MRPNPLFQSLCGNDGEPTPPANYSGDPIVPDACLTDCQFLHNLSGRNHRPKSSLQDAEKAITEELYGMTVKEREGALYDIHGVADCVEEHPEFVQARLAELAKELQERPRYSSTEAYYEALDQSPDYVQGMYLMFLRCEEFRVRQAADRMMRHFEFKKNLFGVDTLGRDITLKDFDKSDMECLRKGFLQLLPQRDIAGRAIVMKTVYHQTYQKRENIWRLFWYMHMTALLDVETQRKGVVTIIYNVAPGKDNQSMDAELLAGVGKFVKASPLRPVAIHYCFLDSAFGSIIKFISTAVDRNSRIRTRLHHGNHLEVHYELMSFGIPISAMPVNSDGIMKVKEHQKWIKNRQKHEKMLLQQNGNADPIKVIAIPSRGDVLFGRGKSCQMHMGNLKLSNILEERSAEYFATSRQEKLIVAMEIVHQMKREGARFLDTTKDNGLWVEVNDQMAAESVGHRFRNRKPSTTAKKSPASRRRVEKNKQLDKTTSKEAELPASLEDGYYVATKRFCFDDADWFETCM